MGGSIESELMRGSLNLLILSVLVEEPKYGYLIVKNLREISEEMVRMQAGTLYPILHRLESQKLIRGKWDKTTGRKRKWYELTAAGRRHLTRRAKAWSDYAKCVQKFVKPVLRASLEGTA